MDSLSSMQAFLECAGQEALPQPSKFAAQAPETAQLLSQHAKITP